VIFEVDDRKLRKACGADCLGYTTSIGRPAHGQVRVLLAAELTGEPRPLSVWVAAHEFGHVLGLFHEDRRCALMNPAGTWLGGQSCGTAGRLSRTPWLWRCRVLEPDDVRGAVSIYGGRARRRPRPYCETYRRERAPAALTLTAAPGGSVAVSFRRAGEPRIPKMIRSTIRGFRPGFSLDYAQNACPARPDGFLSPWSVGPGGTQHQELSLAPGRWCVVVRGTDRATRPGATARAFVDVP
jgi:Matrixin